ncbi:outer membrane beta-barrel protein [Parendozoicomonas sp. Alg238-R29]|uniref:outer membrane beta-barrel protein n=1 Tax=Parendozoicomonas sp. Alg238-R29 TaxID=2993446 RepID=UPI00248D4823|nr:outer membrane beta-barrel protein [Parendozoicomonas sp. Alg238-R29]
MNGMNKLAIAVASITAGAMAQAAEIEPGSIQLGAIELTPKLLTEYRYDDNVFREGDKSTGLANKSSDVFVIAPSLDFRAKSGLNEYGVVLEVKDVTYSSEHDADYTDYGVLGDLTHEFNSRNRIAANLQFGSYSDEGATRSGVNDKAAPEYDLKKGGFVYGFGSMQAMARIDVFANFDDKDYDELGYKDKSSNEYGATVYYRLMPKTDILFEVKERKLDYDDKQNINGSLQNAGFDITSYLVGVNWEATAKTSGYAKFGRRYRTSEIDGVSKEGYNGWEVGVSYMPLTYSVIQLSAIRDYGLESDNPVDADFTKGTTTRVSWDHSWSEKVKTRAFGSYTDEEVQNAAGQTTRDRAVKEYGVAVDYNLKRWVTLTAGYTYTDRNEDAKLVGVSEDNYDRNVYMLSANFTL